MRPLGQFGDDFGGFFQRPGESGTAADKPQAAVGQCVFGNVIAVGCLDDLHHIAFAGGKKNLLAYSSPMACYVIQQREHQSKAGEGTRSANWHHLRLPLLAQSGHHATEFQCPLFGGKADIARTYPDVCF